MRRVAVLLLLLGGGGCVDGMAPSASVSSPDAAPMAEVSPTAQGGVAVDEQKRVAELVEQIKSDLASRQSLSVEQIQLSRLRTGAGPTRD